jgi:orotate phosphoribosyltransferase
MVGDCEAYIVKEKAKSIEDIFIKAGAVRRGHFLLSSGLHSPVYWEKFQVLQYPEYTEELCRMIAARYRGDRVEVVAGPTTGGVILAYEVARQLGVRGIFAEKTPTGERAFRRGFSIGMGERVLIVDDIMTTGSSIHETIAAVKKLGGNMVGIGILVDRSETRIDFGMPLFACHRADEITYRSQTCPLCAGGIPLVKPGGS